MGGGGLSRILEKNSLIIYPQGVVDGPMCGLVKD